LNNFSATPVHNEHTHPLVEARHQWRQPHAHLEQLLQLGPQRLSLPRAQQRPLQHRLQELLMRLDEAVQVSRCCCCSYEL
jgi:hypothetical protein